MRRRFWNRIYRQHESVISRTDRKMAWLYDLPLAILCILCLGSSIAITIGGVLVVRKLGWLLPEENSGAAFAIHAFVGVVYAVALGLIVVGVQEGYGKVEQAVVVEASAASDLFRTMERLDEPQRTQLQTLLHRYVDRTIHQEWPALQHARLDEPTWQTMDSLARAVFTYQPTSETSQQLLPELVQETERLLDARRERLFLGSEGVGPVIWMVVLIGGLITLSFVWFFPTPSQRAHITMGGLMAAMFGLMIFLIVAMDHPLWGAINVSPGALETVIVNMDRWTSERSSFVMPAPPPNVRR